MYSKLENSSAQIKLTQESLNLYLKLCDECWLFLNFLLQLPSSSKVNEQTNFITYFEKGKFDDAGSLNSNDEQTLKTYMNYMSNIKSIFQLIETKYQQIRHIE